MFEIPIQLLTFLAAFVVLMVVMNTSFELILKPVDETTPDIIKKVHKTYLVGLSNIFVLYLAFIYISFHYIVNNGFIDWIVILANVAFSFIVLVMSADALRKIQELGEYKNDKKKYKIYVDLFSVLIVFSIFLLLSMLVWVYLKRTSK